MTELDPSAGYGVFQTTVDAVYRLVPEAERITDPNNSTLPSPITEDTIVAWIEELSDLLAAAVGSWETLGSVPTTRVLAAARAAVANGVASYVEAARYPTLAGTNESTYAGVLWQRYQAMTASITGYVTTELTEGGGSPPPDEEDGGGVEALTGPFAVFPPAYFADGDPYYPWAEPVNPVSAW